MLVGVLVGGVSGGLDCVGVTGGSVSGGVLVGRGGRLCGC